MNAQSPISPVFPAVSSSRGGAPSKRTLFNWAQATMVAGYLAVTFNPLDGDAMQLGLLCQMVALALYVFSREAPTGPSST